MKSNVIEFKPRTKPKQKHDIAEFILSLEEHEQDIAIEIIQRMMAAHKAGNHKEEDEASDEFYERYNFRQTILREEAV